MPGGQNQGQEGDQSTPADPSGEFGQEGEVRDGEESERPTTAQPRKTRQADEGRGEATTEGIPCQGTAELPCLVAGQLGEATEERAHEEGWDEKDQTGHESLGSEDGERAVTKPGPDLRMPGWSAEQEIATERKGERETDEEGGEIGKGIGKEAIAAGGAQGGAEQVDGEDARVGVDRVFETLPEKSNAEHLEADAQETGEKQKSGKASVAQAVETLGGRLGVGGNGGLGTPGGARSQGEESEGAGEVEGGERERAVPQTQAGLEDPDGGDDPGDGSEGIGRVEGGDAETIVFEALQPAFEGWECGSHGDGGGEQGESGRDEADDPMRFPADGGGDLAGEKIGQGRDEPGGADGPGGKDKFEARDDGGWVEGLGPEAIHEPGTEGDAEEKGGDDTVGGGDFVTETEGEAANPGQLKPETCRAGQGEENVERGDDPTMRHGRAGRDAGQERGRKLEKKKESVGKNCGRRTLTFGCEVPGGFGSLTEGAT